jgi:signal transduction protein with GAF and PtsI domain
MTDRATLVERVAAEMQAAVGAELLDEPEKRAYRLMATAAIAIIRNEVLEEAAKVAAVYGPLSAAAIRALKGGT